MGRVVNYVDPLSGDVHAIDADDPRMVYAAQSAQWVPEAPESAAERTINARTAQDYDTAADKLAGGFAAVGRGATIGLSDLAARGLGVDGRTLRLQRESLGSAAAPLELAGSLAPSLLTGGAAAPEALGAESLGGALRAGARLTPAGLASRAGAAITGLGEGGGALAKVGASALGAGVEGGLYGVGQDWSDQALADDPLTIDHLAGSVTSKFLATGIPSAGVGAVFSGLEHGLGSVGRRFDRLKTEAEAAPAIADDLATLDHRGLDAAREAELTRIEADRVPQRAQLGADVAAFRDTLEAQKPWIAVAQGGTLAEKQAAIKAARGLKTAAQKAEQNAADLEARAVVAETHAGINADAEGGVAFKDSGIHDAAATARAEATAARDAANQALEEAANAEARAAALRAKAPAWMGKGSAVSAKSDMALDRILDDPKALSGLAGTDQFRSKALAVQTALRKQETAYEKILAHADELKAMHKLDSTTARADALAAIPAALAKNRELQQRIDGLIAAPGSDRLASIKDAITSYADRAKPTWKQKMAGALAAGGAVSAVYRVGGAIPGVGLLAPLAGAAAGSAAMAKLGRTVGRATAESIARQKRAVDAFLRGTKVARKVAIPLTSKVLASARFAPPIEGTPEPKGGDIRQLFDARADEIARVVAPGPNGKPVIRPEARAAIAARLAPIANVAPVVADKMESAAVRKIEFLADKAPKTTMIGMIKFPPSEMAIRAFARYVAAADDPGGIEERLADGTVTPEDREVMLALYPDRMAAITQQIVERMDDFRKLPYARRLALSIFTGASVEPTMEPRIIAQLQRVHMIEPGSEGGTQDPKPMPAFGSVKKPEGTPAQMRAQGA